MIKEYEKYIKTSLAGIDKVPYHWRPIKLKFIGNLYSGLSGKSGDDFYNPENPMSRPYISFKNIAGNSTINPTQLDYVIINPDDVQNKVKKGDLFFLMSSENFEDIGKTAVLKVDLEETYLNSFCRGFRINDDSFNPSFLNYILTSELYRQMMSIEAKGFTRINIQVGKIQNFQIFAPFSLEEQTQIAQYLDFQTSIIDQLIQKKGKLIELLKEKRQAVINEAVTKGLNPNAKMKDSGIEWLGEVPERWEVTKMKFISTITRGAILRPVDDPDYFDENGEWTYLNISDATKCGKYLLEGKLRLSLLGSTKSARVLPNNLILTASATIGKPFINKIPVCVHDGFIPITNIKCSIDYLYNYLRNPQLYVALGKVNTQKNIYLDEVKDMFVTQPPLNEQIEIVAFLERFEQTNNELTLQVENQIENLKEYRQSLISEAVTGKIDVRNWQPIKQQEA
jgi:type I restriction enzyme S subunit